MKLFSYVSLALVASASLSHAAIISVQNYSFNTNPNNSYPDTGGSELTDGVKNTNVWGGVAPTLADVAPLVGWFNTTPSITFNFTAVENVQTVSIWMADSDGSAGVALPSDVTISTAEGFSQTFAITNPATTGEIAHFDLNGFSINTNNVTISATRVDQWAMISEVEFNTESVPEPSSLAFLGLGSLALLRRKRK